VPNEGSSAPVCAAACVEATSKSEKTYVPELHLKPALDAGVPLAIAARRSSAPNSIFGKLCLRNGCKHRRPKQGFEAGRTDPLSKAGQIR
jgi:hypothetical protein